MKVHAISADSPDMSETEVTALRESIATIGQQVPILIWRGEVIDGRKRLAACQALGIEPVMQTVPDDGDPSAFAHALNLLRTHYTPSQRAAYAERLANATKGTGPTRRHGNDRRTNADIFTLGEAARRLGVTRTPVAQARRIRRTAAPEVMQAVERGALTLHAAEVIATKVPHEEQPAVVEQVIAEKQGKRNAPSKVINAAAPGLRKTNRRDVTLVRDRALRTIHACTIGLEQFMEYEIAAKSDRKTWRKWISESIHTLRALQRKLEVSHERSA